MKKVFSFVLSVWMVTGLLFSAPVSAVASDEAAKAEQLLVGETTAVTLHYGKIYDAPGGWVTFTPEETGIYQFNFYNSYEKKLYDFFSRCYAGLKDAEKDNNAMFSAGEIGPDFPVTFVGHVYELKAGVKYYLNVWVYCDNLKNVTIPIEVVKHTHSYAPYVEPATKYDPGDKGQRCSTCGAETGLSVIPIYDENIKLSAKSYSYDGKVKTPSVTVKDVKGKKLKKDKDYTVSYAKGRKSVGQYTVTVKFKGDYYGTEKRSFKIVPKGTELAKLTAKSKGFTVKWKKQTTQTSGYQIQYSTDSHFKKNNQTKTVSKNKTTSVTVKKLKAKKKYYVRIRTYKTVNGKKYYSAWSGKKAITTKK